MVGCRPRQSFFLHDATRPASIKTDPLNGCVARKPNCLDSGGTSHSASAVMRQTYMHPRPASTFAAAGRLPVVSTPCVSRAYGVFVRQCFAHNWCACIDGNILACAPHTHTGCLYRKLQFSQMRTTWHILYIGGLHLGPYRREFESNTLEESTLEIGVHQTFGAVGSRAVWVTPMLRRCFVKVSLSVICVS